MPTLELNPKKTAVLLMDLQTNVLAMQPRPLTAELSAASSLAAAARKSGAAVIYVVVAFRPGFPEAIPGSALVAMLKQRGGFETSDPVAAVHESVRPNLDAGDVVVVKHRLSAFSGSDLDMILRAKGVDTLVLAGVATNGVVVSTAREAYDKDYRLVVARDACFDADEEVHRVLLDKVIARVGQVVAAADVAAALGS
jgi:nicotinamidase-related amidase